MHKNPLKNTYRASETIRFHVEVTIFYMHLCVVIVLFVVRQNAACVSGMYHHQTPSSLYGSSRVAMNKKKQSHNIVLTKR